MRARPLVEPGQARQALAAARPDQLVIDLGRRGAQR